MENKVRELRQLQALIEEAQAEAESLKDAIKAAMGGKEAVQAGENAEHATNHRDRRKPEGDTTMTQYFKDCQTLDEMKKAYKAAALANHPDLGGDTATMQAINAEYSARFEVLKDRQNTQAEQDETGSTQATTEAPNDFIDIIDHLLHMDGLTVELCGRWLWIGGETMKHKEALKACGCRWSSAKKLWSWHHIEEGARWHKSHYDMNRIRSRYGSEVFGSANDFNRAAIAG